MHLEAPHDYTREFANRPLFCTGLYRIPTSYHIGFR